MSEPKATDDVFDEVDDLIASASDPSRALDKREEEIEAAYALMEEDAARIEQEYEFLDKRDYELSRREAELERREKRAEAMLDAAERELKSANPYHPALGATYNIAVSDISATCPAPEPALQLRLYVPGVQWDDCKKQGCLKLALYNQRTGQTEVAAYGVTEKTLLEWYQGHYLRDEVGKKIADELFDHLIPTVKEHARKRRTY